MPDSTRPRSGARSTVIPFTALRDEILQQPMPLRAAITAAYRRDEGEAMQWLQTQAKISPAALIATQVLARTLVESVRRQRTRASGVATKRSISLLRARATFM